MTHVSSASMTPSGAPSGRVLELFTTANQQLKVRSVLYYSILPGSRGSPEVQIAWALLLLGPASRCLFP